MSDDVTSEAAPDASATPDAAPDAASASRGLAVLRQVGGAFSWLIKADPRALGLFRVAFGALCLIDVLRRWEWIRTFYSNEGVLSNHFTLFKPHTWHTISFLNALSRPGEVQVFFVLAAISLVFFIVGYRTKLFHVLSMVGVLSIHSRNVLLENGGDVVMNLWWLWTLFLPLGRRFSVDALLASLRARKEKGPAQLNLALDRDHDLVWSLAVFAVIWQLCLIYFFNTAHKSGAAWHDGTAVAWTLEQDRVVRPIGLWAKAALPLIVFKLMTWGTLVIEGGAVALLLSPVWVTACRRTAFLGLIALHMGIFVLTDVGLFSWVMMVSYLILLTPPDIALLKRGLTWLAGEPITAFYDSDCGVCLLAARVGHRWDLLDRVTWGGRDPEGPVPEGYTREAFEDLQTRTLVAWDGQRVWTRHHAVARVAAALPGLRLLTWVARVPALDQLLGLGYDAFASRRHRVSAWLGMGVCGVNFGAFAQAIDDAPTEPSPARRHLRRAGSVLATAAVAFFMAATMTQVLAENTWVRKRHKFIQPAWGRNTVEYGRWFQGWSMFAPDAPKRDGCLVMDVELADGRRLDPQTMEEPVYAPCDRRRMAFDQFWGSYSMRIAMGRNQAYRNEFEAWLKRPGPRLGLTAQDRVRRFKIYYIGDTSPAPKSGDEPVEDERILVAEWPHPKGA